jgi:hypothetical protein
MRSRSVKLPLNQIIHIAFHKIIDLIHTVTMNLMGRIDFVTKTITELDQFSIDTADRSHGTYPSLYIIRA